MNGIKQKLKEDSQAFKITPDSRLHRNIMKNIQQSDAIIRQKSSWFNHWLIPAGFMAAASLILVLNLSNPLQNDMTKNPIIVMNENVQLVDFDELSTTLEANLLSSINLEKQALQKDFEYMQSLFIL